MLSRVADCIYWLNRYLERADNIARFVQVNTHLMLDTSILGDDAVWRALVEITGDHDNFLKRYGTYTEDNVKQFLTFDVNNPNSILESITRARDNARFVSETITSEMWECINRLYLYLESVAHQDQQSFSHEFYEHIKLSNHLFIGLTHATMSHNEAWHFSRLGRKIERADKTSRLLDVSYFLLLAEGEQTRQALHVMHWAALLKSASALEMYLKKYHLIEHHHVVEFLLFDKHFPRSVSHCLRGLESSLLAIFEQTGRGQAPLAYVDNLLTLFTQVTVDDVLGMGLHAFIDNIQTALNNVHDATIATYCYLEES